MRFCSVQGCGVSVTDAQAETTEKLFGKAVCVKHQKDAAAEASKEADKFTLDTAPYIKCGFEVKDGVASKIIGQAEIVIYIGSVAAGKPKKDCIQIGGYDYEYGVNPEVDAEIKTLYVELGLINKNGTEKPAKAQTPTSASKPKEQLPARQEKPQPPGKPLSDAERDAIIEDAKAKRWLSERGSSYKVQGKERPDSHQIQKVANERGISLEILSTAHTETYVEVKVRAHLNNIYCDAVVHHEFKDEYMLKTMEVIYKNPAILDHWEGTDPVIKEGAMIMIKEDGREVQKDAKYFIVHSLLTWKKFAMRDARTKAGAIAEAMLLNQDFREPEEKQSELDEAALVQESIKNRKGVR